MRKIYLERKSYVKYDESRFMVYLNEEVVNDYVPDEGLAMDGAQAEPRTAYAYTGPEQDGGTLIDCVVANRDNLINGIIRSRYSQTEEDAIKTHQIELLKDPTIEKAVEYDEEWTQFNAWRRFAIESVDSWLR